jgi:GNAT superfamily N-acetyltransferase
VVSLAPDADDATLAAACLHNTAAIGEVTVGYRDSVAEMTPGVHRHRTPVPGGLWNTVGWTDLPDDGVDDAIAATLAWYGGSCRWWTGAGTRPEDLGARLTAAGFVGDEIPAMVCDLSSDWDAPDPEGLVVERCDDPAAIDDAMVIFEAVGGPGDWLAAWADVFAWHLHRAGRPIQMFVGRLGGEPVACGWLARGAGVAGVYGVQTLPEHRGKGYGAALTRAPMRAGRDAGDRVAVLQAAPLAEPLYARIGFRTVAEVGLYER